MTDQVNSGGANTAADPLTATATTKATDTTANPNPEAAIAITGAQPAQPQNWYETLEDKDIKGWLEIKGYKDPIAAHKAHRELEKFVGKDPERILEIPKDFTNQEQVNQFYTKLGRPETPEGYDPAPEGSDKAFTDTMMKSFFEAGVPKAAVKKIMDTYNEFTKSYVAKQAEDVTLKQTQEVTSLKQEWGTAYDNNLRKVDIAAEKLGLAPEDLDGLKNQLGAKRTMQVLAKVFDISGEPNMVAPGTTNVYSPDGAKAKQEELLSDQEFNAAFLDKYHPGHKAAVAKFNSLSALI